MMLLIRCDIDLHFSFKHINLWNYETFYLNIESCGVRTTGQGSAGYMNVYGRII